MTKKDYTTQEARQQLREEVKHALHSYISSSVRRVFIPKHNKPKEKRPLGIPTVNSYYMPPNKVLDLERY
ncbi:hypothetical protein [Alicyclobacillus sp. SO9]|uniref:hypothetical protein n=1 Tax=Alicyclobacillus sp. SO9 TaxID=2665646 RepID=UPI0018E8AB3F|nr:hypothetical protein [Alicyclobacillus sp. SO9]